MKRKQTTKSKKTHKKVKAVAPKPTQQNLSVNWKRVLVTIFAVAFLTLTISMLVLRFVFIGSGGNEGNRRGKKLQMSLVSQIKYRDTITAEALGAEWFSALSAGNLDKVLEGLSLPPGATQTQKNEEITRASPYLGQKWDMDFPAVEINDSGDPRSISTAYRLTADGTSKDGQPARLTIELSTNSDRYDLASINWSVTPLQ